MTNVQAPNSRIHAIIPTGRSPDPERLTPDEKRVFDLVARRLCEMETFIFVSLLMLRDARLDPEREILTERFVQDGLPVFRMNHGVVLSGDVSLIDNYQRILDM